MMLVDNPIAPSINAFTMASQLPLVPGLDVIAVMFDINVKMSLEYIYYFSFDH
jgi:hypothetical protein